MKNSQTVSHSLNLTHMQIPVEYPVPNDIKAFWSLFKSFSLTRVFRRESCLWADFKEEDKKNVYPLIGF